MALDPTYPSIPIFNLLAVFLVLVPLPWQFRSWNVGACAFSIWSALQCLDEFIRTVLWRDRIENYAPVYCDLSTRIQVAVSFANPACSLAINLKLLNMTRYQTIAASKAEKRKEILKDIFICLILPLLNVPLYYIVQSYRFYINEQLGCGVAAAGTIASLLVLYIPPILPSLVSVCIAPFTALSLIRNRKQMREFYQSNASISQSHFFRLLALSNIDTFILLPVNLLFLALSAANFRSNGTVFWPGWNVVHNSISEIVYVPAGDWRFDKMDVGLNYFSAWMNVVWAAFYFLFFGTTQDMRKRYLKLWYIIRPFGFENANDTEERVVSHMQQVCRSFPRMTRHLSSLSGRESTNFTDNSLQQNGRIGISSAYAALHLEEGGQTPDGDLDQQPSD